MALSVVKNLETICPVDNPKVVTIGTDNQFSTVGVKAVLSLLFTTVDETLGHLIMLRWNGITKAFALAASPDNSGLHIHVGLPSYQLWDWVALLCEDLSNNYYLSRDFDLVASGPYITITAKADGEEFTLEYLDDIEPVTGLSADPAPVSGVTPVLRDFYSIILQVKPHNSDVLLGQDMVTPDVNGHSSFDIHDLLCDYLTPEFAWPHEAGYTHVPRLKFLKKFRVQYAETYDRHVYKLNTLPGDHYAVLGGFDYKILAALNGIAYSYLDFITTFKAFLTWQPAIKPINKTQREKLFYLVFNDISNVVSFIKIYFTDGTTSSNTQIASFHAAQYDVIEFFTDYISLDIAGKEGQKTALKYDFWLQDESNNIISQVRTYEIEFRRQPFSRILIFRNSFGAYDIFRATGRKKHVNNYERMILERNSSEYTLAQQYQILESESFQVSSGFISRSMKNWLRELMLSEEVFEIIGDYRFPILIQNEQVENIDDQETIYEVDIKYKYAFKNPKYSELSNTMPLLAENLNALLNEDGNFLFA
ncbi:MAG TPA: hypothetical protein PKM34_02465 [Bacteroidales bacterium]|nr:hypothetical protein [Bacteroidales bacterium]